MALKNCSECCWVFWGVFVCFLLVLGFCLLLLLLLFSFICLFFVVCFVLEFFVLLFFKNKFLIVVNVIFFLGVIYKKHNSLNILNIIKICISWVLFKNAFVVCIVVNMICYEYLTSSVWRYCPYL